MRISDWSSDVCSSDLAQGLCPSGDDSGGAGARRVFGDGRDAAARDALSFALRTRIFDLSGAGARRRGAASIRLIPFKRTRRDLLPARRQLGSASCWESVFQYFFLSLFPFSFKL